MMTIDITIIVCWRPEDRVGNAVPVDAEGAVASHRTEIEIDRLHFCLGSFWAH